MKTIVLNNPAAKESGALTILRNFLEIIYKSKCKNQFYIFVSLKELKKYEKENVKIIVIGKQSFKQRILWDNFGLKKYLQENNIVPNLFISLQNTGVNLPKEIPQILYFHQALSMNNFKWSIFNKEERKYFFYQNIYPFFIKQYLKRIKKIIVQAEWVKKEFSQKFDYSSENIIVIKPKIKEINIENIEKISKNKFRIFYPATPLIYKNHKLIIKVLGELKKENPNLDNKLECIFTFSKGDNIELDNLIRKNNLENIIKLIGKISYEEVLSYYKSSDLMIFPSYIETLGLPLLEAQHFGLEILAIDLPYSREVIGNYKRIKYLKKSVFKEIYKVIEKEIKCLN